MEMQRSDDGVRTPNIKRNWGSGLRVRRGTRVIEEGHRSANVDEAAFDLNAVVSSPGRGLRGPTCAAEAARTPCRRPRAALCTRPLWLEDPDYIKRWRMRCCRREWRR